MTPKTSIPKNSSNRPPSLPKRGPYKFLPRNLRVSVLDDRIFQKICAKGLYLRKIIDTRCDGPESVYIPFKRNKLFKTLQYARIPSVCQHYFHENLKNSKNLKGLFINSEIDETSLKKIALTLKKLPAAVLNIKLRILKEQAIVSQKEIFNIAKSIRLFPKLEYFERKYDFDLEGEYAPMELKLYNQAASRLKNVKKLMYKVSQNSLNSVKKTMGEGVSYPNITGLDLSITAEEYPNYRQLLAQIDPENSNDEGLPIDLEHTPPDELIAGGFVHIDRTNQQQPVFTMTEKFMTNLFMRELGKVFYRFELFSNLRQLRLYYKDYAYPLGSFVVDGFKALTKLEELKIEVARRPMGTHYLFQALLELPLLKKFKLKIAFIGNEEWSLLAQFLTRQTQLEALAIRNLRKPTNPVPYLKQNQSLDTLLAALANTRSLKFLTIKSTYWSLEALSEGLNNLTMPNQLHTLKFEVSDENVTCDYLPWVRVEGLWNFICDQKGSLRKLHIKFPHVYQDNIVTYLAEAISKATKLRELELSLNFGGEKEAWIKYCKDTLQSDVPQKSRKELLMTKTWNPCIGNFIKRLENLETFDLEFTIEDSSSARWFVDVMKALSGLEKLRKLEVNTDSGGMLWNEEEIMCKCLWEMKNIVDVDFYICDEECGYRDILTDLEKTYRDVSEKQSFRCDLMF